MRYLASQTWLSSHLQNSLVSTVGPSQDIIDVKNVVVVLIVITVVVLCLARLREYPSRVQRGLVGELRVADIVRLRQSGREALERLRKRSVLDAVVTGINAHLRICQTHQSRLFARWVERSRPV
jgi:ribosomal protein S28E/S33